MVENPVKYFEPVAAAGGDSVTFHYEAVDDVAATIRGCAREQGSQAGVAFNPETEPEAVAAVRGGRRHRALHEHPPGLLGAAVQEAAYGRVRGCGELLPERDAHPGRRRRRARRTSRSSVTAARRCSSPRRRSSARGDPPAAYRAAGAAARVTLARAVELARAAPRPRVSEADRRRRRGRATARSSARARPRRRGRHAEVVALAAAGERARGATLYVSLEPCDHHGTTPPCTDAILAAGVARVVFGATDPNPRGGRAARSGCGARASTSSSSTRSRRAPSTRRGARGSRAAAVRDLQGRR